MFLIIPGYTKVIFIIYIFIYNLETRKVGTANTRAGIRFQKLAHGLRIMILDRRG